MNAGELRHRLFLQRPSTEQDAGTGQLATDWVHVAALWASVEPLSARDFIAAGGTQASIAARVVIRWRKGLATNMRLVSTDGAIYEPVAFLADPKTGREYVTIPCRVQT